MSATLIHSIIERSDRILITGANGFIGSRVVESLLAEGFTKLRCLVRSVCSATNLRKIIQYYPAAAVEVCEGDLLSRDVCRTAVEGVAVIYHLAAGRSDKSYPSAYMNSAVTTRNLLDAAAEVGGVKRIVCVSSFTVYSTARLKWHDVLDETCIVEDQPHLRGDAYCYAKVRQEEIFQQCAKAYRIPHVIVRPGVVYGPGNKGIPGRVGLSGFGVFLHVGGSNRLPLTYVDNCADAIVLAGIRAGADGEIFNIVDDDLPTSRQFLKLYKEHVRSFRSLYLPHCVSYFLSYLWERYSAWSEGQLPPVFNRRKWFAYWNGHGYSNQKVKAVLGWKQKVPFAEAARRYFESEKATGG